MESGAGLSQILLCGPEEQLGLTPLPVPTRMNEPEEENSLFIMLSLRTAWERVGGLGSRSIVHRKFHFPVSFKALPNRFSSPCPCFSAVESVLPCEEIVRVREILV